MLKEVRIKNLALINEAVLDLESGLNIMTGETGSGKSIIINSINIALGEKANKSMIRTGEKFGLAELLFTECPEKVLEILDEAQIPRDGTSILITRRITADSSIARINGETANLAAVKKITSGLIDIYGQHDHQSLLDPANHINILDMFAGDELTEAKEAFSSEYRNFKKLREKYKSFEMTPEELARRMESIRFECKEIEEAELKPGEDRILEEEYKKLSSLEMLSDSLNKLKFTVSGEESGITASAASAAALAAYINSVFPGSDELKSILSQIKDIEALSSDLSHELSRFVDKNSFDREIFEKVKGRLDKLNKLKSKYGNSVDACLEHYDKAQAELASYEDYNRKRAELVSAMSLSGSHLKALADTLTGIRKKYGEILSANITELLDELNFNSARFEIRISSAGKIGSKGADNVEFLISTNMGEPLLPLARIASGGELSRIMLAIKSAVAEKDDMPTLIFDEIDTGISGRTAQKVSEKLAYLSVTHQLICITHLPQIAAMADHHFCIKKEVSGQSTITGIDKLDSTKEAFEIARLISGDIITNESLKNAEQLKSSASLFKASIL